MRGAINLRLLRSYLVNLAVFVTITMIGGLGTAWYMVEAGSRLSTRTFGPWTSWVSAGRPDADPYTRAHTARNGLLPLSSTLELTYRAKHDSNGRRLHSSCEYTIVMDGFEGAWWDLAVFDASGRIIQNAADRHAFNANTVMRQPDGSAVIVLARDARPGNWLPTGGGNKVTLLLTIQDTAWAAAVQEGANKPLPEIQRMACN